MSKLNDRSMTFLRPKLSKSVIEESEHLISICTEKLSKFPSDKKAILLRGSIYLKLSQFEESKNDWMKLTSDPVLNSTVYYLLGCLYEKQNKFEESKDNWTRALDLDPDNVNALFLRGAILNCLGYFQEAIDDYCIALEKDSLFGTKKNIYRNIEKLLISEERKEEEKLTSFDSLAEQERKDSENKSASKSNSKTNSDTTDNTNYKIENNIDYEINNQIKHHFKELSNFKRSGWINNFISTTGSWSPPFKSNSQLSSLDIFPSFNSNSNTNSIKLIEVIDCQDIKKRHSQVNNCYERKTHYQEEKKELDRKPLNMQNYYCDRLIGSYQCESEKEPDIDTRMKSLTNYLSRSTKKASQDQDRIVNVSVHSLTNTKKNNRNNMSLISNDEECEYANILRTENNIVNLKNINTSRKNSIRKNSNLHEWEIYHNQGIAAKQKGEFQRSLDWFTKAIELNKNYFKGYFNRAFVFDKLGEYAKAIHDYTKAIAINPNYAYTYYNRGITYEKINLYTYSINDFTHAISINKKKCEFYYNRGCWYKKTNLLQEAIDDYTKVIKQKPSFPAYLNRGICYCKLQSYTEAINDMNKCILLNPKNITPYCHIANIYYSKLNDSEKALNYYLKITEINKWYSPAYHDTGIIYEKWNWHELAIEYFTKAIQWSNMNSVYYHNRCLAYKSIGNIKLAIQDISSAIKHDPENIIFYNIRALLYQECKSYKNALLDYEFIIKNCSCKKDLVDALFKRGWCWEKSKMVQEAIDDYCQIISIEPMNANAYLKRGCCYETLNMMDKSYKDYEKSLEIDTMLGKTTLNK